MSTTVTKRTSYYGPNSIMGSQGTPSSIIFGGSTGGGVSTPITGNYIGLGAPSNPIYSIPVFSTATDAMGDASFVFDLVNKRLGLGISEPLNLFHMYSAGDGDALRLQNCWIGFQALGATMYDLVLGRWEDYFLDLANWGTGAQRDATCFRITGNLVGYEATLVLATQNTGYEFVDITNNNYPGDKYFRYRMQAGNAGSQWKTFIMDYRDYTTGTVNEAFRVVGGTSINAPGIGNVLFRRDIGSQTFASGFAGFGWKNEYADDRHTLTVDNLFVRNALTVYELIISQIRATNGSVWISDCAKLVAVEAISLYEFRCYVDTLSLDQIIQPFAVNDVLKCQKWTGRNIKSYVARVDEISTDGWWFKVTVIDSTFDGYPQPTDDLVRIGNVTNPNRQGAIYLTANDNNAPYIDVIDGVTSASFYDKVKVRLGKLAGITDATFGTLSGYGLYANNVYLTGSINAVAGYIGGFTISATEGLYAGTAGTRVQMKAGAGFWAGATAIGDAPFSVTNAGVLKATSGTVGGWTLDFDKIFFDSGGLGESSVGMLSGTDDIAFYVGASFANRFTARFNVTKRGELNVRSTAKIQHQGYCEFSTIDKYFKLMQDDNYHYISLDVNSGNPLIQVTNAQTVPTWSYMQPGQLYVEEVGGSSFSVDAASAYYLSMYMRNIPNTTQAAESSPTWKALYVNTNNGRVACGT